MLSGLLLSRVDAGLCQKAPQAYVLACKTSWIGGGHVGSRALFECVRKTTLRRLNADAAYGEVSREELSGKRRIVIDLTCREAFLGRGCLQQSDQCG
jgi:hypothetical protein